MSHTPHELAEDFPDLADRIRALKQDNPYFARLLENYHSLNRDVHRAETRVEPVSEDTEAKMRRERSALKDELYGMLTA